MWKATTDYAVLIPSVQQELIRAAADRVLEEFSFENGQSQFLTDLGDRFLLLARELRLKEEQRCDSALGCGAQPPQTTDPPESSTVLSFLDLPAEVIVGSILPFIAVAICRIQNPSRAIPHRQRMKILRILVAKPPGGTHSWWEFPNSVDWLGAKYWYQHGETYGIDTGYVDGDQEELNERPTETTQVGQPVEKPSQAAPLHVQSLWGYFTDDLTRTPRFLFPTLAVLGSSAKNELFAGEEGTIVGHHFVVPVHAIQSLFLVGSLTIPPPHGSMYSLTKFVSNSRRIPSTTLHLLERECMPNLKSVLLVVSTPLDLRKWTIPTSLTKFIYIENREQYKQDVAPFLSAGSVFPNLRFLFLQLGNDRILELKNFEFPQLQKLKIMSASKHIDDAFPVLAPVLKVLKISARYLKVIVGRFPRLRELNVDSERFSGQTFAICEFPRLQSLVFLKSMILRACEFLHSPNLQELELKLNSRGSSKFLNGLLKDPNSIATLKLLGNSQRDGVLVKLVGWNLFRLRKLYFAFPPNQTFSDLVSVPPSGGVETLEVKSAVALDYFPILLGRRTRRISLCGSFVTGEHPVCPPNSFENLKSLSISTDTNSPSCLSSYLPESIHGLNWGQLKIDLKLGPKTIGGRVQFIDDLTAIIRKSTRWKSILRRGEQSCRLKIAVRDFKRTIKFSQPKGGLVLEEFYLDGWGKVAEFPLPNPIVSPSWFDFAVELNSKTGN